jgi:hypothetical protein
MTTAPLLDNAINVFGSGARATLSVVVRDDVTDVEELAKKQ